MLVDEVPADPAVLMDFLNTLDERTFTVHGVAHAGGDEVAGPADAIRWLRRRGLIDRRAGGVAGEDVDRLRQLRHALRTALAAQAGHAAANPFATLNGQLAQLPLIVQLDRDGDPRLNAAAGGILGSFAETLARVVANGQWHRLRMCAASDCRWVFYDTSRNARGRWCSMAVCGNRDKTRRYRERHAT